MNYSEIVYWDVSRESNGLFHQDLVDKMGNRVLSEYLGTGDVAGFTFTCVDVPWELAHVIFLGHIEFSKTWIVS